MNLSLVSSALIVGVILIPTVALFVLAAVGWIGLRVRERVIAGVVGASFASSALLAAIQLVNALAGGTDACVVTVGRWFAVEHYAFDIALVGDHLSLPFALFSSLLLALVSAFSRRYLHRESGYFRFYFLLTLFGVGVDLVVLSNNLAFLFFGWEFVGISSALLIAFFHERSGPVENGLRTFVIYRICDVGLLAAVASLEVVSHSTALVSATPWAVLAAPAEPAVSLLIGVFLLWATIGKSAQLPFGNWLPRAMEGPTPSSAIFYGAISVHLGPYLLLRALPYLEAHPSLSLAVVIIGAATAGHASFVGRVQTDIKSVLAYASMTQVGLIFVEIGLGLPWLALVHIVGHSALRTLEILRSPNLIHDHFHLEQAIGTKGRATPVHLEKLFPTRTLGWWYRLALERGYWNALLHRVFVVPFLALTDLLDRADRRLTATIEAAGSNEESDS